MTNADISHINQYYSVKTLKYVALTLFLCKKEMGTSLLGHSGWNGSNN